MGGYLLLMKVWISGNYLFSLVHVSGVFCGLWSMDRALCMRKGDIFKKLLLDKYIRLNKGGYFRDQYISLLGSIDTC